VNRARMTAQSPSDRSHRVMREHVSRSSGTAAFVHAYRSNCVYAHPCTGDIIAVLVRKSVGYIGNH
jgi:hypothetical protein